MATTVPSRPTALLKLIFILPRYLYRVHLGWTLGHMCLMVTHIGRKTGRRRQTVLEVVHYDPSTQECIVMSGYGTHSDWYRNIQVHPATEVRIGRQCYVPQQRMLSEEETLHVLEQYCREHPWRFRELIRLVGYSYHGTQEELRAISQMLRGVAFCP